MFITRAVIGMEASIWISTNHDHVEIVGKTIGVHNLVIKEGKMIVDLLTHNVISTRTTDIIFLRVIDSVMKRFLNDEYVTHQC